MKNATHPRPFILIISLFVLCLFKANANTVLGASSQNTIFNSIYREGIIDVILFTDMTQLIENKRSGEFQKARFSYVDNNGNAIERKMKVTVRGKYRRKVCDIPPVMLKFSKKDLAVDHFEDDNKLKFVTHCYEDNVQEAEQNLLKEYLIYKMLNELTEKSFRVQLVKITYVDTKDNSRFQRLGFIIESTSEFKNRIKGASLDLFNVDRRQVESSQYNTIAMFQYMISNTDWELAARRNIKIFTDENTQEIIVVPYDFDFAGLINSRDAIVNPNLPPKNLRERYFLGEFQNEEQLDVTLNLFRDRKEKMIAVLENNELLRKRNCRDVISYMESFYDFIEDEKLVVNEFLELK